MKISPLNVIVVGMAVLLVGLAGLIVNYLGDGTHTGWVLSSIGSTIGAFYILAGITWTLSRMVHITIKPSTFYC
jgi:hypothetical protein